MSLQIEELRSKNCLYGFRCGLKEIDQYCKKAYKLHAQGQPLYRTRVLYHEGNALGFHTLSVKIPAQTNEALDTEVCYSGNDTFLYIDHLAVASEHQRQKFALPLMIDIIEIAAQTMLRFGRIHALSLNAATHQAQEFFSRWGFVAISKSTTPFMVLAREDVLTLYEAIRDTAENVT